jgi:uncharacterized membrane protein
MTSVVEAEARSAARSRLLWVALALSLTLNVFFIAGLVWSHSTSPRQVNYVERLVQAGTDLNLSPAQRDAFNQFAHTIQERTKAMREANQPVFRGIWDELVKAQPDQAVIARLVDEASDIRHGYQKDVTAALSTFLDSLSPDQRVQFADVVRHRDDGRSRRSP